MLVGPPALPRDETGVRQVMGCHPDLDAVTNERDRRMNRLRPEHCFLRAEEHLGLKALGAAFIHQVASKFAEARSIVVMMKERSKD